MRVCQFDGCSSKAELRGYCKKHYHTMRRRGKLPPLPVAKYDKCKADDCENLVGSEGGHGYCSKHYQRFVKYGDPNKTLTAPLKGDTLKEKLLNNRIIDENGCWNWTGGRISPKNSKFRYGCIAVGNGKTQLVHRLAYKFWVGEIPTDYFVCHKCDNPACFNPDHLFVGTNTDNVRDKIQKKRAYTGDHKGELNATALLTDSQVIEIKKLLRSGMSQKEIGERFGVSHKYISAINTESRWKHIPWPDLKELPRKRKRRSSI